MALQDEYVELIQDLMCKHAALQPANVNFDVWDAEDAKNIVADLIILINQSNEIQEAHLKKDFGK